ncbi:MAG: helix-turn-helix transcriptional regulator [Proteobacteria bacterium]|nr:helix-turn-helix transcriptional regulator [Pseudomonadota bacterium]
MTFDYPLWIREVLQRKPHLSQTGLARHLNQHPSIVTQILKGKRRIMAVELDEIAAYLEELPPGRQLQSPSVPVIGRIGNAWYEDGHQEAHAPLVSPALSHKHVRQVAYLIDQATLDFPAGSVLVAKPIADGERIIGGQLIVVRRERSGLFNLALERAGSGEASGTPVAIAIELRILL